METTLKSILEEVHRTDGMRPDNGELRGYGAPRRIASDTAKVVDHQVPQVNKEVLPESDQWFNDCNKNHYGIRINNVDFDDDDITAIKTIWANGQPLGPAAGSFDGNDEEVGMHTGEGKVTKIYVRQRGAKDTTNRSEISIPNLIKRYRHLPSIVGSITMTKVYQGSTVIPRAQPLVIRNKHCDFNPVANTPVIDTPVIDTSVANEGEEEDEDEDDEEDIGAVFENIVFGHRATRATPVSTTRAAPVSTTRAAPVSTTHVEPVPTTRRHNAWTEEEKHILLFASELNLSWPETLMLVPSRTKSSSIQQLRMLALQGRWVPTGQYRAHSSNTPPDILQQIAHLARKAAKNPADAKPAARRQVLAPVYLALAARGKGKSPQIKIKTKEWTKEEDEKLIRTYLELKSEAETDQALPSKYRTGANGWQQRLRVLQNEPDGRGGTRPSDLYVKIFKRYHDVDILTGALVDQHNGYSSSSSSSSPPHGEHERSDDDDDQGNKTNTENDEMEITNENDNKKNDDDDDDDDDDFTMMEDV